MSKEQSSCASAEAAQANVVSSPVPDTALSAVCKHIWTNTQKRTFFYLTAQSMPAQQHLEMYFEKYFLFCSRPVAMQTVPNALARNEAGDTPCMLLMRTDLISSSTFLCSSELSECPGVVLLALKRASSSSAFLSYT